MKLIQDTNIQKHKYTDGSTPVWDQESGTWSDEILEDDQSYLLRTTRIEDDSYVLQSGENDISSIENWHNLYRYAGSSLLMAWVAIRALFFNDFSTYSNNEQKILVEWLLADKADRDAYNSGAYDDDTQRQMAVINLISPAFGGHISESDLQDLQEHFVFGNKDDIEDLLNDLTNGHGAIALKSTREDTDYNLLGYQKVRSINSKGDIDIVDYHQGYVNSGDTGILRIKEVPVYTRHTVTIATATNTLPATGILLSRTKTHSWYAKGGRILGSKVTVKQYIGDEGLIANQQAHANVVGLASNYLIGEIGIPDAKEFFKTVAVEITSYKSGIFDELLTAISNTDFTLYNATDAAHSDAIKAQLDSILNIDYTV